MGEILYLKDRLREPELLEILAPSQYMPTDEKMRNLADKWMGNSEVRAYGWEEQGVVRGIIVVELHPDHAAEVFAIAVCKDQRFHGIGTALLDYVRKELKIQKLIAETDEQAVGFYQKTGFEAVCLGMVHRNINRYQCVLREK